jgi:NADPH-dependent 2,4-dienoyl-CoA reductase/sulfur reductase-like enzyme
MARMDIFVKLSYRSSVFFGKEDNYETKNIHDPSADKARLLMGAQAKKLYPDRNIVELEDGRYVIYKKLLLATGATPILPDFASNLPASISSKVSVFRNASRFCLEA